MASLVRLVGSLSVLAFVSLLLTIPQEANSQPPSAEAKLQGAVADQWVGVFNIRKQIIWLRLKFERETDRVKLVILASQPRAATGSQDVRLDSSRVRFAVTVDSAQLFFDGRFRLELLVEFGW